MDFFNGLLDETELYLSRFESKVYTSGKTWRDAGKSEVILRRDAKFELDGTGFNLVTSRPIGQSCVTVIGPELIEISADAAFARIAVIQTDDRADGQETYKLIKKIEYAKYHYYPEGFMIRTASSSHRETVRVAKTALGRKGRSGGITFEGVGNILINKYIETGAVKSVRLIYITDPNVDFSLLESFAARNHEITETLNHVMNSLVLNCSACKLKPVCDEVEGMRELHFGRSRIQRH